jgi:two-component system, cell cycle response regulator DivK
MTAKILIADDDFDNRTIVKEALEASGYEVAIAVNGEEALEMAINQAPEVLLLDLSMPRLSGWEVAKRLRQTVSPAHLPIVAFTAHALAGDELKARAAGCDDYIAKPCLPRDVVQKVKEWLGRTGSERAGGISRP